MGNKPTSRDAILRRLREAPPDRRKIPGRREEPSAITPVDTEAMVKDFSDHAIFAGAIVKRIPGAEEAGREIAAFMKESGFTSVLLSGERIVRSSPIREALKRGEIDVSDQGDDPSGHRDASFSVDVGVTGALAGIAVTGTVALPLGDGYSRLISLAPFAHVVLLPVNEIVPDTHDFWSRMPGLYAKKRQDDFGPRKGKPDVSSRVTEGPGGIVFVTGPSMTGDIALTAIRGIHGPGKLLVLLLSRD